MEARKEIQLDLEEKLCVQLCYWTLLTSENKKLYLCLSRHDMYNVEADLKTSQKYKLSAITSIICEKGNTTNFQIVLEDGTSLSLASAARSRVVNEIQIYWKAELMMRTRSIRHLPIKYEASINNARNNVRRPNPNEQFISHGGYFMFVPTGFKKVQNLDKEATLMQMMTDPSQGMKEPVLYSAVVSELDKVKVVEKPDSAVEFTFFSLPEYDVASLARSDKASMRLLAESEGRKLVTTDYVVVHSKLYRKKRNLVCDPSSWKCHEYLIRTKSCDIAIIIARRKYSPPYGDKYQDFVFVLKGGEVDRVMEEEAELGAEEEEDKYNIKEDAAVLATLKEDDIDGVKEKPNFAQNPAVQQPGKPPQSFPQANVTPQAIATPATNPSEDKSKKEKKENPSRMKISNIIERIVDVFSPENENFYYDDLTIRKRLDSLNVDEDTIEWCERQLKVSPKLNSEAKTFVAIIASALYQNDHIDGYNPAYLFPTITLPTSAKDASQVIDPLEYVETVMLDSAAQKLLGLPNQNSLHNQDKIMWRRRLSRFLAVCLDGHLSPEISIKDLVRLLYPKALEDEPKPTDIVLCVKTQMLLSRVLQYLLHLKPSDIESEYDDVPLERKISDPSLMNAFSCNERMMAKLLEYGYLEQCLQPVSVYVALLAALLNSVDVKTQPMLLASITARIARDSMNAEVQKLLFEKGVVKLLISRMTDAEDELVAESCCKALVNLSAKNADVKGVLIAERSLVQRLIKQIDIHNPGLASASVSLLNNCMHNEAARETIAQLGFIKTCVSVLDPMYIKKYAAQVSDLFAKAIGAIWTILKTSSLKQDLIDAGFLDKLGGILAVVPPSGDIMEKSAGAILVIAAGSEDHSKSCGPLVRAIVKPGNPPKLLKICITALAALANNEDNIRVMKIEGSDDALDRASRLKDTEIDKAINIVKSKCKL